MRAMSDVFSAEKRSQVMARVKGRDTVPEMKVRRLLTAMGLRYRLHRRDLPGAPDIAWRGGGWRSSCTAASGTATTAPAARACQSRTVTTGPPRSAATAPRDPATQAALAAMGWTPLVIWECELKDEAALKARLEAEIERGAK